MSIAVNQLLNGRYEIVRRIKSGGMGAVYEASDQNLAGSRCAVKEILESALSSGDADYIVASFNKEMKALAQLNHPGIPRVRDFFELNNNRYIVMDLVQGKALDEELATHLQSSSGAGLDPRKLAQDMVGVVEIVQYLHSQTPPLVHRDIKPANMIRDEKSGRILLVDFGLARTVETIHTQTQVGTLGYCAPEQMMGRAEMRSDIYSLGATMAHLLSGKVPNAFNFDAIQIELPGAEGLAKIVERATQPKLDDRYASAADLADALRGWLADSGSAQPAASQPAAPRLQQDAFVRTPAKSTPTNQTQPTVAVNNNREHLATVLVGAMACATLAFGIHRMTSVATNSVASATPNAISTSVLSQHSSSPKVSSPSPSSPTASPAYSAPKSNQGKPTTKSSQNIQTNATPTQKPAKPAPAKPAPTTPPPPPQVSIKPSLDEARDYPSAKKLANKQRDAKPDNNQEHLPSVEPVSLNQASLPQAPSRNTGGNDLGSFVRTPEGGYSSGASNTNITFGEFSATLSQATDYMKSTRGLVLNPQLSNKNEACMTDPHRPLYRLHIFATRTPGIVRSLSIFYTQQPSQQLLNDVQKVLSDFRSHRL